MDPRDVRDQLLERIQEDLLILAAGYSVAENSATMERLSAAFQAMAICQLLESGNTLKYGDNLARSAFARRYFLSRSATSHNDDDRRLAISRTESFFDALAAGHGLLAREIAELSRDTWREGWEYADDFYYRRFLHRVVIEPELLGQPASAAWLDRYAAALESDRPPRFEVLRALVARDAIAVNAALRALMIEHDEQMQARKERLLEPDLEALMHWPRTFVCVEGLALIAIATAMGMAIDDDIPLCPPIARLRMTPVAIDDPFVGLEMELKRAEA